MIVTLLTFVVAVSLFLTVPLGLFGLAAVAGAVLRRPRARTTVASVVPASPSDTHRFGAGAV